MKRERWKRIGRGFSRLLGTAIDIALVSDPVRFGIYKVLLNRLRTRRKLKRERNRVRGNDGSGNG